MQNVVEQIPDSWWIPKGSREHVTSWQVSEISNELLCFDNFHVVKGIIDVRRILRVPEAIALIIFHISFVKGFGFNFKRFCWVPIVYGRFL